MWRSNLANKEEKRFLVVTSWDDGHFLDVKLAKLLSKYNLKGTFFVTTSYLEPLSIDQLIEIDKRHEIGAHTLTHPNLTDISIENAKQEICGSKSYLEESLGHEINTFCYPRGRFNEEIKQIVKKCGFIGARTCNLFDPKSAFDRFEQSITLHTSNGSPRLTIKLCYKNNLNFMSFFDWEERAKALFEIFQNTGGFFHIWGHSWEFENKNE